MTAYNNRPYRTRKEIILSCFLQGLVVSQLSTQVFSRLFDTSSAAANVCGLFACALYTLCKLLVENANDPDLYLNDDRIVETMSGCMIGECLLIL